MDGRASCVSCRHIAQISRSRKMAADRRPKPSNQGDRASIWPKSKESKNRTVANLHQLCYNGLAVEIGGYLKKWNNNMENASKAVSIDLGTTVEKPAALWFASTPSLPGYWGSSKDGALHSIASCRDAGASPDDIFIARKAYEGCHFDDFGGLTYLADHGEPAIEGIYDAAGRQLGDDLADAAKEAREGWRYRREDTSVGKHEWAALLKHNA
jgi:hypothetical protein